MESIDTENKTTENAVEDKKTTVEEKITRYALVIFAILLLLIIYTFITMQSPKSTASSGTQKQAIAPAPTTSKLVPPAQETTTAKITPKTQQSTPLKTTQEQEEPKEMKPDDYKIPGSKKQKLTELLPTELKESIQASLPSEAELKAMTPRERAQFQETQKKLAVILRDLGRTEAENRKLQSSLSHAEVKKQKLSEEVEKLERSNK